MSRAREYAYEAELAYELEAEHEALIRTGGRDSEEEWELNTTGAEYTIIPARDDRVRVPDTRAIPFRHICKLEMVFINPDNRRPQNFIGTGTLIGPSKVLTAAHCVFDRHRGLGFAQQIRVIPGKRGAGRTRADEPFGFALSRRLDVPAAWRTTVRAVSAMPFDYGVITLDRPLGQRIGWWQRIGHKPDAFLQRYKVNTSGYPGDRGGNQQYRVYDRVVRTFPQRLEFVHDVAGGQSGSPIWVRWQQFRKIVGIVTTHDDPLTAVVANTGVRITPSVLSDIRSWLRR